VARVNSRTSVPKRKKAKVRSTDAPRQLHKRPVEVATTFQVYRCAEGCHAVIIFRNETDTTQCDSWTFIPIGERVYITSIGAGVGKYRLRRNFAYNVPRTWLDGIRSHVYPTKSCWKPFILDDTRGVRDME